MKNNFDEIMNKLINTDFSVSEENKKQAEKIIQEFDKHYQENPEEMSSLKNKLNFIFDSLDKNDIEE